MDAVASEISKTARMGRDVEPQNDVATHFGSAAFYIALASILIFAIPRGTVDPWIRGAFVVAAAMCGALRLVDAALKRDFRIAEPAVLLPMIGIAVLGMIQIAPLPFSDPVISEDPYETRAFLLVFGALLVYAEVLFKYTNSTRRLKYLVAVILAVALGSSLFGFVRELFVASGSDPFSAYLQAEQGYGQFLNRNHFALLIEMGIGLLTGLLLKSGMGPAVRFAGWVTCGILAYSIIATTSRGGLTSLAGIAVFASFTHILTRHKDPENHRRRDRSASRVAGGGKTLRKIAAAAAVSLLTFVLVVFTIAFIGGETVVHRVEKLSIEMDTGVPSKLGGRYPIWTTTVEMIKERPLLGSGFGAYATAFPRFDHFHQTYSIEQAHNEYLEILANGGLIAFSLFAACAVTVIRRFTRNLTSRDQFRRAVCFGSILATFAVLIHSFVDFGLHVVINAMVLIGIVVAGVAKVPVEKKTPALR